MHIGPALPERHSQVEIYCLLFAKSSDLIRLSFFAVYRMLTGTRLVALALLLATFGSCQYFL